MGSESPYTRLDPPNQPTQELQLPEAKQEEAIRRQAEKEGGKKGRKKRRKNW